MSPLSPGRPSTLGPWINSRYGVKGDVRHNPSVALPARGLAVQDSCAMDIEKLHTAEVEVLRYAVARDHAATCGDSGGVEMYERLRSLSATRVQRMYRVMGESK